MDKVLLFHLEKSLSNLRTLSVNLSSLFRDSIHTDMILNKERIIYFLTTLKNQLTITLQDFNYVMSKIDNHTPIYYHIDYFGVTLQVAYNTLDGLINLIKVRFSMSDVNLKELILNTLPLIQDNIDLAYTWITESVPYYSEELPSPLT